MNQFQCEGGGKDDIIRSTHGLGGGKGEDGTDSFPPGKEAVFHRALERSGAVIHAIDHLAQTRIDDNFLLLEVISKIENGRPPEKNAPFIYISG
jgi:hypothetical protein